VEDAKMIDEESKMTKWVRMDEDRMTEWNRHTKRQKARSSAEMAKAKDKYGLAGMPEFQAVVEAKIAGMVALLEPLLKIKLRRGEVIECRDHSPSKMQPVQNYGTRFVFPGSDEDESDD
jgi:hypothetical protein